MHHIRRNFMQMPSQATYRERGWEWEWNFMGMQSICTAYLIARRQTGITEQKSSIGTKLSFPSLY